MNFLIDVIPPKARRYVYGVLSLLALAYASWEAAGGDWRTALTSLVGAAVTALAHANTNEPPADEGDEGDL